MQGCASGAASFVLKRPIPFGIGCIIFIGQLIGAKPNNSWKNWESGPL